MRCECPILVLHKVIFLEVSVDHELSGLLVQLICVFNVFLFPCT